MQRSSLLSMLSTWLECKFSLRVRELRHSYFETVPHMISTHHSQIFWTMRWSYQSSMEETSESDEEHCRVCFWVRTISLGRRVMSKKVSVAAWRKGPDLESRCWGNRATFKGWRGKFYEMYSRGFWGSLTLPLNAHLPLLLSRSIMTRRPLSVGPPLIATGPLERRKSICRSIKNYF